MFQTPKWSSDEEDNVTIKKKKHRSEVPAIIVTHPTDVSVSSTESGKKKKKKKKKKKDEKEAAQTGKLQGLASQLFKKIDRVTKSPTMTNELLETSIKAKTEQDKEQSSRKKLKKSLSSSLSSLTGTVTESASQVGSLLSRGIRFTSESEFVQFISGKSHKKKKKKKHHSESETGGERDDPTTHSDSKTDASPDKTDSESPKKKKKKKKKTKSEGTDTDSKSEEKERGGGEQKRKATENGTFATPPPAKKPNFDIEKLKEALGKSPSTPVSASKTGGGVDDAKSRLKSSQFRYLNEKLYNQNGAQSFKMFSADKDAFRIYHEGYLEQLKRWPMDPLNIIMNSIIKASGNPVVADFGCGEARLARAIASSCKKVHSFDLVAANELVTVCDMTRTPLDPSSVDIAVFCLSLMGTNLRDYIKEANRVLKDGGILKIAEVESRFQEFPVEEFVNCVERCGFKLKWKDLTNKYFYLMDFVKTGECKKKAPEFSLKPCFYKKR